MKKLTDAERRNIVRWYQHGDPIRTIAKRTGASYGAVNKVLHESGTAIRPRGGSHR